MFIRLHYNTGMEARVTQLVIASVLIVTTLIEYFIVRNKVWDNNDEKATFFSILLTKFFVGLFFILEYLGVVVL